MDFVKSFAAGGPVVALYNSLTSSKSSFTDITSSNYNWDVHAIIALIIIIIIYILMIMATYKLTNSVLQAILYAIFSTFYLICAYLYYGLTGYKYRK